VAGDWGAGGRTGIGVFDPAGTWYLRNTASPGTPDVPLFAYGLGSWTPLAGAWTPPSQTQVAAHVPGPAGGGTGTIDEQDFLGVALARLHATGAGSVGNRTPDALAPGTRSENALDQMFAEWALPVPRWLSISTG
jgi:hypothetical protein